MEHQSYQSRQAALPRADSYRPGYLDGVIRLYCDDIISDEEIAVLSEEPLDLIIRFKNTMR